MYKAKDAMCREVVLWPEATAGDAMRLLVERGISGAPVVDQERRLVGIISEHQLLEVPLQSGLGARKVGDLMTQEVISLDPDAPLQEVVTLFCAHRIRRLPVVEDGRLVGIVCRRDVLRYLVENGGALETLWRAGRFEAAARLSRLPAASRSARPSVRDQGENARQAT